ncbi:ileal sodium/bile acid cotransporter-like [Haliotis cracherodii]|uniref:ileal sodium/bile acid cotransporter-like n=1 Tax=Haliotis cracherodii TaxID=6455 RepID=UPI0039E86157
MKGLCPFRWFVTVLCGFLLHIRHGFAGTLKLDALTETPVLIDESDVKSIVFNTTLDSARPTSAFVHFVTEDPKIAVVTGKDVLPITENATIQIRGLFLGQTYVKVLSNSSDLASGNGSCLSKGSNSANTWCELDKKYEIIVSRKTRPIDTVFNVVVICLVVVANIAMGCKVEIPVVKETMKRPIAPITGLASQFILMPVISFLFAYFIAFQPSLRLGFFALGCSPGGSASNIYSYLIGGDVSLSVTMTFISTVASLALIPLWLFTLGTHVLAKGTNLKIPFTNIFASLVGLVIPIAIGLLIQHKRPEWAKKLVKIIRPITVIFLVFVFTVGVYANWYIFRLLEPVVLIVGCLLPYCGFFFGGLVAFFARQSKKNIITIAIETGIQNTGIAIVLLRFSLPAPAKDISIVAPIASAIFTPIPLVIAILYIEIRKRCFKKYPVNTKASCDDHADMIGNSHNSSKASSRAPVYEIANSKDHGDTLEG